MFVENEIIQFTDASGKEFTERILWIDAGYVICFTISVFDEKALPIKRKISELEKLRSEGILIFVEEVYPLVYRDEKQIPDNQKLIRDSRWEIIKNICLKEPDIYQLEKRGSLVNECIKETGISKGLLYKHLKQFWREGKVKNSLLPKYSNSGGKGGEKNPGNKKRGRPKKFAINEGVNVDDEIKRIFQISIKKYYQNSKGRSLQTAYEMMVANYFAEDYIYENGVKKPLINDTGKIPSFGQFQYWFKKLFQVEENKRKRLGDRKYELEHRAVLGNSVGEMYGPGTKYQIDATVADVYVVSDYNRDWIIGRPIVYVVIDVFSRMVTGIYVGLEGPSWLGASMAIANAASDKVAFCKEFGIDIAPEQWNTHHLPETLIADRGELEGYNPERLITAFNIKIENTPPYRADWKGIVEQHFRLINLKIKPFLPGVVDTDIRIRGERDYRLDAKLTLKEFTNIIIKCVLFHNNEHWLKNYNTDEMMIEDEVKLIPRELWNWGIKNRSGSLRKYTENVVKLHLLPQANATVTYTGIKFKGMKYTCESAIKENWFSQAREKSWRIKISYDPRNMDYIYLASEDGKSFEVLRLLEHQQRKYSGYSFYDIDYLHAFEKYAEQKHQSQELQKKIDLQSEIMHIANNASKLTDEQRQEMSYRKRVKGIRENRAFEKEDRRKEEAFLLEVYEDTPANPIVNNEEQIEVSSKSKNKMDLLRQKQKEMKGRATGK